jgi:hypothetical protein
MSKDPVTEDQPIETVAPKSNGRGGLLIALGFIAALVLLVALNMR